MVDHTSEELIYNIQADHEELQFMHETYAEILGGTIEQAREVHARAEIAKLLAEVATPGWYYLNKYNDREGWEAARRWAIFQLVATSGWYHNTGENTCH